MLVSLGINSPPMRPVLALFCGILLMLPFRITGQPLLAGQTSGDNIVYHDIEDLHIDSPYWNSSDNEYMDLNDDGIIDLNLMTSFTYWSHLDDLSASARANAADNCQYSTYVDQQDWIKKHEEGDPIDGSLNWYAEPEPLYSGTFYTVTNSKSIYGRYSGSGYLAYRILGTDTTYGWIRISSNVSFNGAYLTVYDFAFYMPSLSVPTGPVKPPVPQYHIYGDQFIVDIPEQKFSSSSLLRMYDLSGKLIFERKPGPGLNSFSLSSWHNGLYLIQLIYGDGQIMTSKLYF